MKLYEIAIIGLFEREETVWNWSTDLLINWSTDLLICWSTDLLTRDKPWLGALFVTLHTLGKTHDNSFWSFWSGNRLTSSRRPLWDTRRGQIYPINGNFFCYFRPSWTSQECQDSSMAWSMMNNNIKNGKTTIPEEHLCNNDLLHKRN